MSEFYATSLPVPFTWSRATKLKLNINRKLPFQGNSKQSAQFHTKNILAKNKHTNKTKTRHVKKLLLWALQDISAKN